MNVTKGSEATTTDPNRSRKRYTNIKNAIEREVQLLSDIKDARDELNILMSIAKYQRVVKGQLLGDSYPRVVEGQLLGDSSANQAWSAKYIERDLEAMDELAKRIIDSVGHPLHPNTELLVECTNTCVLIG